MTTLLNQERNFTTKKELDRAVSLFIAEKIAEGYTLLEGNPISSKYDRMLVFRNEENEKRYGFGIKRESRMLSDLENITIQWGELEENTIFTYVDEKNVTVEEFVLIRKRDYRNPIYVSKEEAERIEEIKEKRRELRYRINPVKVFKVDKLNMKGLKRPGNAEITVMRIAKGYNICKDNKAYKEVRF